MSDAAADVMTESDVNTFVENVKLGDYPDANDLDRAIVERIEQLEMALREACGIADAAIFAPTANTPPVALPSGLVVVDGGAPYRAKARIAELRKLAGELRACERIEAAAIEHEGVVYSVPRPGRHSDVCHKMMAEGLPTDAMRNQGFLTSSGRFVGRTAAAILARAAGQLLRKTNPTDLLFSEDVW
jgi:hypothetical protein